MVLIVETEALTIVHYSFPALVGEISTLGYMNLNLEHSGCIHALFCQSLSPYHLLTVPAKNFNTWNQNKATLGLILS
jgi:hypothetical protein